MYLASNDGSQNTTLMLKKRKALIMLLVGNQRGYKLTPLCTNF